MGVSTAAAEAVGDIGPRAQSAVPDLIAVLDDQVDFAVRRAVAAGQEPGIA